MNGQLIFVRHSESEWNAQGRWTGLTDIGLTKKGKQDARAMGETLRDITLHHGYTSELKRTHQTFSHLLTGHGQTDLIRQAHAALNERDYGQFTGKNKWEVQEEIGKAVFQALRRGWDHPVPGGETLKMVHDRVVPFYGEHLVPHLHQNRNVLVVSHGNTIRSLIKHIEDIPEADIADVEMPFGTILVYQINEYGKLRSKAMRAIKTDATPA